MKKLSCPNSHCQAPFTSPAFRVIIRDGSYTRRSDSRRIARFLCKACGRRFSHATKNVCFGQKRRNLNHKLYVLITAGVSQRRAARILHANRKTIVRKFRFLAGEAKKSEVRALEGFRSTPISFIQFDDLETAEHTKCKPISIALAVDPKTRRILSFQASRMPAKGHLSELARKKYGQRPDERGAGWNALFHSLQPYTTSDALWLSDENPHYPRYIKRHHPEGRHETVKGRRGCIAGQGELKKIGHDPLFSLNHTCAMLRANLNRLFRRTWCLSKTLPGLVDHLWIYQRYHNEVLIHAPAR